MRFSEETLKFMIKQADIHVFPDKAIDLLDETAPS
jgi:hypothetical protein